MTEKPKVTIVTDTGAGGLRMLTGAGAAAVTDVVSLPPEISGPHGRAWEADLVALRRKFNLDPTTDASLAGWVIEAPWAHPVWHSYIIGLVHLRPLSGMPAAVINLPGATHQFWLWAANPERSREQFLRGDAELPVLTPVNFSAQLLCADDESAMKTIKFAIGEICAGRLNPDTDALDQWITMFGNNMLKAEFRR
ncbi:MAG: hypothetical protein J0H79_14105 [Alphaproteobacteria bacterium]|nr:hypothetical protein [Alphaproteobacteria bacterium]